MPNVTVEQTLNNLNAAFIQEANSNDGTGAAAFKKDYIDYLNKFTRFRESHTTDTKGSISVSNPMFGGENFRLKSTTEKEAKVIIQKGKNAQKIFGKMSIDDRLDFISILDQKIKKYAEDIKLTITADMGKPIDLAAAEVSKASAWPNDAKFIDPKSTDQKPKAKKQLEQTVTVGGKKYQSKKGYEPAGMVHVIGAFNYPLALTMPGIIGGLAAGNNIVISTPEKAPNWIFPFMQAAEEAAKEFGEKHKFNAKEQKAFKDGLIQYAIGRDPTLSTKADVVHFVGGDAAGKAIKKARGNKPTILELGGSNVVTVMNDAVANDTEAKEIAKKIYGGFGPTTGQRCTAPRILLVEKGEQGQISAETVAKHVEAMCVGTKIAPGGIGNPFTPAKLKMREDGKPIELEAGTKIGPLVDNGAYEAMKAMIKLAGEVGAEVHGTLDANVEGSKLPKGGHWVNPIAIDWSKARQDPETTKKIHAKIKEKEIFGPLIHIISPVQDLNEAIKKTNELDTHNLASAIFTKDAAVKDKYFEKTYAISQTWNDAPSDKSPGGEHGHPNERHGHPIKNPAATDAVPSLRIGGLKHYLAYCKEIFRKVSTESLVGASR